MFWGRARGTFNFFRRDNDSCCSSLCFTFTLAAHQLAYQFSSVLCNDISSGRAAAVVAHVTENFSSRPQCFAAHSFGTTPKDRFDHPPDLGEKSADLIATLVDSGYRIYWPYNPFASAVATPRLM